MARRRMKRKTTRRRKSAFNLFNAAELYVQTSILTQGAFNVNPIQFITGRTAVHAGVAPIGAPSYFPNTSDSVITLPELIGLDPTLQRGSGSTAVMSKKSFAADPSAALATISANVRANAGQMIVQTIGTRAAFAVAKRFTTKQRSMINNGFKMVGLKEVKV